MNKKITFSLALSLIAGLSLFAQTVNGPGEFSTFTYNFNSGSMDGWVKAFENNSWVVKENPRTVKQELHWIHQTFARTGYNFNGYGALYENATFENFELSFQVTSNWNNRVGVIFNWQDSLNFNAFIINVGDQRAALYQRSVENAVNVGNWAHAMAEFYATGAIDMEGKIFTIRLRNHEGLTSAWVNDVQAFNSVAMPLFKSGKIAFYGISGNEVYFDNLKVISTANLVSTKDYFKASSFSVYPNPASDWINVRVNYESASITLSNVLGARVMELKALNKVTGIDLSGLTPGVYYITVNDGKSISTQKIFKR